MASPHLIAIAGASGSGKSFLARYLAEQLPATVIAMDCYYHDLSHLPLAAREQQNFDVPEALDWDLLRSQLVVLAQGHDIERPVYDFAVHARSIRTETVRAGGFIIVEGLFALYDAAIRTLCRTKIFLAVDQPLADDRRLERDMRERGRTRESVLNQLRDTVQPMYQRYVLPTKVYADLLLDGAEPVERLAAPVRRHIGAQSSVPV